MKAMALVGILSTVALVGCGGGQPEGTTEQEIRPDPCATVRCAAGTHCVAKGHRASCVPDEQTCRTDADCRLFDNYCDGCACDALNVSSPDPFCGGTLVECFREPCGGLVAACQGGKCVATTPVQDTSCGSNHCGAGEYCCNASCGICAPFGSVCIQIACAPTL
jgi:hypothetical protein